MRSDNLDSEVDDLRERVRKLETQDPLGNASVRRGSTRFIGNESLKVIGSAVISGWLIITGTLKVVGSLLLEGVTTITGALTATGTTNLNGPVNIAGNTTATGTSTYNGNVDINGTLNVDGPCGINGLAFLRGNVSVEGGGRLRVGTLTLDPSAGAFGGALVSTSAVDLIAPSVNASANFYAGGTIISTGTLTAEVAAVVNGALRNPGAQNQTLAANTYVDAAGRFWRVSSARRFKIDPQPTVLDPALLKVDVVSWIDNGTAERYAKLLDSPRPFTEEDQAEHDDGATFARVPGVIAEEVLAAGGEQFVGFSPLGEIESVAYDRLALARTALLARMVFDLQAEVKEMRESMAAS